MSGHLRFLYEEILDCEPGNAWDNAIKDNWVEFKSARSYYRELGTRRCEKWPEMSIEDLWNLYSVSRVSDLMLLSWQSGDVDGTTYAGPNFGLDEYLEFFTYIGFIEKTIKEYHPFYCEILGVIRCDELSQISVETVIWPAMCLKNMLFTRAGVIVKAPAHLLTEGVADKSMLYWSHWRKNRPTNDLSDGWGSNSQWRTRFRRDYDLGDAFAYNVDSGDEAIDLRLEVPRKDNNMQGMLLKDRINFLKNRCATLIHFDDSDLWPYYDYFEEKRS